MWRLYRCTAVTTILAYDDGSCAMMRCEFVAVGIAEGACDCDGNVLDECGVCGGGGIADGACDCDGNVLDECGVCGGAGIADGNCDCDGSQFDVCGICGGDGTHVEVVQTLQLVTTMLLPQ